MDIKHRHTGVVLYACAEPTIAAALVAAVASEADLRRADLRRAYLSGANLGGADLSGAVLYEANLREANLRGADLRGASLRGADLREANLYGADLREANLCEANLREANLRGADLYGAALHEADLYGAALHEADLRETKGLAFQIPQEGELIVWKSVHGGVCKLRVPPEAKRTATPVGRKCRAEWVEVLTAPEDGRGRHNASVVYRAGEIVRPDKYDDDIRVECTHGIHFFLTEQEARDYQ